MRFSKATGLSMACVVGVTYCSTAFGASLPLVRTFPTPNLWANGLTFVGDNLWVWDVGVPNTFYEVDSNDGHILTSHLAPETFGGAGLGYDGQYLWGSSGGGGTDMFVKMDPKDGSVIASYPLPVPEPTGITFDGTHLWVSQIDGYDIAEVDPATGSVIRTIQKEPFFSFDLAWDGQALWLSSFERGDPERYYIYRIDPSTGLTLGRYDGPAGAPGGMEIKDNLLYVTSWWDNQVFVYQIPEPASLLLLMAGSLLIGPRKRKSVEA